MDTTWIGTGASLLVPPLKNDMIALDHPYSFMTLHMWNLPPTLL